MNHEPPSSAKLKNEWSYTSSPLMYLCGAYRESFTFLSPYILDSRLFIGRRKGRPRLRWMDDGVADLRVMKIRQWTEKVEDREQWRLVVMEAKAHPGL